MKVLIFGGSGMLGHKLWQTLAPRFETYVTFRGSAEKYVGYEIFEESRSIGEVAAENSHSVRRAFEAVQPQVVVNCIGIVKQDASAKDPIATITVNSLFPHRLADLCHSFDAKLIHLSTDCVFSGAKGNYSESDVPDAQDLYGRTKLLGEVAGENCLTIRTSMVGRELKGSHGLLEWFMSHRGGRVRGFNNAIFSGFCTPALAHIIADLVEHHPTLHGIYHVAADSINKFELLTLINETAKLNICIEPDESFACDRSLDGSKFRAATGFVPPSWSDMVTALVDDSTAYDRIRRSVIAN